MSNRSFRRRAAAPLLTECNREAFSFAAHFSRRVEANFTAGQVSTDGGALLLRQTDRKINLLKRVALKGAEWAEAQIDTIRRRLFKIGALARIGVRIVSQFVS